MLGNFSVLPSALRVCHSTYIPQLPCPFSTFLAFKLHSPVCVFALLHALDRFADLVRTLPAQHLTKSDAAGRRQDTFASTSCLFGPGLNLRHTPFCAFYSGLFANFARRYADLGLWTTSGRFWTSYKARTD